MRMTAWVVSLFLGVGLAGCHKIFSYQAAPDKESGPPDLGADAPRDQATADTGPRRPDLRRSLDQTPRPDRRPARDISPLLPDISCAFEGCACDPATNPCSGDLFCCKTDQGGALGTCTSNPEGCLCDPAATSPCPHPVVDQCCSRSAGDPPRCGTINLCPCETSAPLCSLPAKFCCRKEDTAASVAVDRCYSEAEGCACELGVPFPCPDPSLGCCPGTPPNSFVCTSTPCP